MEAFCASVVAVPPSLSSLLWESHLLWSPWTPISTMFMETPPSELRPLFPCISCPFAVTIVLPVMACQACLLTTTLCVTCGYLCLLHLCCQFQVDCLFPMNLHACVFPFLSALALIISCPDLTSQLHVPWSSTWVFESLFFVHMWSGCFPGSQMLAGSVLSLGQPNT